MSEEASSVWAKVRTAQIRPGRLEQRVEVSQERGSVVVARVPGYRGGLVVAQRQTLHFVSISLWDSEPAARASEEREDVRRARPYHLEADMVIEYWRVERVDIAAGARPHSARLVSVPWSQERGQRSGPPPTPLSPESPSRGCLGHLILVNAPRATALEIHAHPEPASAEGYEVIRWALSPSVVGSTSAADTPVSDTRSS